MKPTGMPNRTGRKGRLTAAIGAVLLAAMLAACGSQTAPSQGSQGASTQSTGEKVIKVMYVEDKFWQDQAAAFTKATGIKVQYETVPFPQLHDKYLSSFVAQSSDLDVVHLRDDWAAEFGSKGFLAPLDQYVTPDIKSRFAAQSLDNLTWDGKLYGVPRYIWLWQFYYNKELLAAKGFDHPPATWTELVTMSKKITDSNTFGIVEPWGGNFSYTPFLVHLRGEGGEFWDYKTDKPAFNSPAGKKALQLMYDLVNTDKVASPAGLEMDNTAPTTELFTQGKIAFIMNTPYTWPMSNDAAKSKVVGKVGVALVPGGDRKTSSYAETGGVGIPAASKHKDWAWEYVKFVTSKAQEKEMGMQLGRIPADLEDMKDPELLAKINNMTSVPEQIQYPYGMFKHPKATQITDAVSRHILAALTNKESVDQALAAPAADATRIASAP